MHDIEFLQANHVFVALLKELRREGRDKTQHKEPTAPADMGKLYQSGVLSNDNPKELQNKVYFELSYHFARRGRERLRELRKDSFSARKDSEGVEYVYASYHEKEKNHSGVDPKEMEKQVIMCAQPGDPRCPVYSFKLYMSKLHDECNAFFQRPKVNVKKTDAVWYYKAPVGQNKLGSMMSDISKAAELSRIYTNHCIRATTATALHQAGVESNRIAYVTGHRSTDSLKHYISGPSEKQKKNASEILHSYGDIQDNDSCMPQKQSCVPSVANRPMPQSSASPSPSTSGEQFCMPLHARFAPRPGSSVPSMVHNLMSSTDINAESNMRTIESLFYGGKFENCTFSVNINMLNNKN